MTLVFVDDHVAADFQPFALTRPCCELRAGALLVRQRWERATGLSTTGFASGPHLKDFDEPGSAAAVDGTIPAGSILVNARCAVALRPLDPNAAAWSCGGRLAAVRLNEPALADAIVRDSLHLEAFLGTAKLEEIDGVWLDQVWDFIRHLTALLTDDIGQLAEWTDQRSTADLTTTGGTHPVFVEDGATIDPMVVLDPRDGPILVRQGASVQSFTRLVGPCLIGEGTTVNGGRISGSSIGEHCRVHGEVSASIFTGHANKGHDGFLGHSMLGRWVNIGAGTVNSNLKNNYSEVSMWTPRGVEKTGMQFLGALIGDHAKTAIGTRLTTGAIVGAGANVYGPGMTSRYVPPFAWGLDGNTLWELDAFLETAGRAMHRRNVELTEKAKRQLTAAWERAVDKR
jgi:UDP-N-acetylglucosamine diphosphorylase/glucosamine-1-phosphate N-acetyltransferase